MSFQPKDEPVPPGIKKIIEKTKADFDEISTDLVSVFFQFLQIKYQEIDYYSRKNEFNHKIVDRKIISEKRGIFTTPGKSGSGHDAYFQSYDTTDNGV